MTDTSPSGPPADPPSGWPAGVPVDDMDGWYTRCPDCGLVGPAAAAEIPLTGPPPHGVPDWTQPVRVRCFHCGHSHPIRVADVLGFNAQHVCPRAGCGALTPVPSTAAEVVCRTCRLYAPGPATRADRMVADQRHAAQTLHTLELQHRVREGKRRAGLDPDRPYGAE